MKKLLILMPTKERPTRMLEAVRSFIKTTDGTHSELRILIDNDDKCLGEYLSIIKDCLNNPNISYRVGSSIGYTNILNREFEKDNEREFYCVTNDDILFETEDWDKKLSVDFAITTGYEPNMHEFHGKKATIGFPIISVIDGRICRELGWLQYPELDQGCGDNVWHLLGVRCKNLLYNKNVVYIHNHAHFGKAEMDTHYHKMLDNKCENSIKDFKIFMNWAKYKSPNDVGKINNLLNKNNRAFKLRSTITKKTPK